MAGSGVCDAPAPRHGLQAVRTCDPWRSRGGEVLNFYPSRRLRITAVLVALLVSVTALILGVYAHSAVTADADELAGHLLTGSHLGGVDSLIDMISASAVPQDRAFAQIQFPELKPPGKGTADEPVEGVHEKFDAGFYEKIQTLAGVPGQGISVRTDSDAGEYYDVVIVVATHDADGNDISEYNKDVVEAKLLDVGAQNIFVAERLSFLTASIPISAINAFSLHGEVYGMGDGLILASTEVDTARVTINATAASLDGADGTGVTVAVIDNGINHPLLNDKTSHVACGPGSCSEFSDIQSIYDPDDSNKVSHGTTVAHIIATSGGTAHRGVAQGVDLISIHGEPDLGALSTYHALDWAVTHGAAVSNISLSFGKCDGVSLRDTQRVILNDAVGKGIFVAVSASNNGHVNGTAAYHSIFLPGCFENVVAVGGISDRQNPFMMYTPSSRGPVFYNGDLSAPILKPEIVAPANLINVPARVADNSFGRFSGTSFSAPMVSAAAAILIGQDGAMNPREVRAALLIGADWQGPVPCTSVQYENNNASDNCSYARQPADSTTANNSTSLGILNNVGFGILDVGQSLQYVTQGRGSHVLSGSLGAGDTRTHKFAVTDTENPVKVLLTWNAPVYLRTSTTFQDRHMDLGFSVQCPGIDEVQADSSYQNNEFAVFRASQAGTCTVTVTGDSDNRHEYTLASTETFVPSPLSAASVTSVTNDGTYGSGDVIDVRVGLSEPATLDASQITRGAYGPDGREFRGLDDVRSVATAAIGSSHYALATGPFSGVQIINITDPSRPTATVHLVGDNRFTFNYTRSVATAEIGDSHYALVASERSHGVQIIEITDPAAPEATVFISSQDNSSGLVNARHVATAEFGGSHYALVTYHGVQLSGTALYAGSGVQIFDITNPASPRALSFVTNSSSSDFYFTNPIFTTTTEIGDSHYALTASEADHRIQITDITNPASPQATASIAHLTNGFNIRFVSSITATEIDGSHYAIVTAAGSGVQIINITDPAAPRVAAFISGTGTTHGGLTAVTATEIDGSPHVLVADFDEDTIRIIEIADPTAPRMVASVGPEEGIFDQMDQPLDVAATVIDGSHYALIASSLSDGIQIIEITVPTMPTNPLLPSVAMDVGPVPRHAAYSGFDGNQTMIFKYVVMDGDHASDLEYDGSGALDLKSNLLRTAGNDAAVILLPLPEPGTANSLSHNKDIRINTLRVASATYAAGNGTLTIEFNMPLNGTVNYDLLHIRNAGQGSGGLSLGDVADRSAAGSYVTATLSDAQRAIINDMTEPQLDMTDGAVSDLSGNPVDGATDLVIRVLPRASHVVQAGDDQTVGEGDTVTLSGTVTDHDDDPITYTWSQTAPTSPRIEFANSSASSTTFVAPAVTGDTPFTITLTADDDTQSATDTLSITVRETGTAFITTWNTTSADQNIIINFVGSGMNITWGDGTAETGVEGSQNHTYAKAGSHPVSVTGGLTGLTLHRTEYLSSPDLAIELASIDQWGDISWTNMSNAFAGASNMTYRATDAPDLSGVTDMSNMFTAATSFNGDLSDWDVSSVTSMTSMFTAATSFDQPLNNWNVSSVINMNGMFNYATSFDQPLNSWDVSSVTQMNNMFSFASFFNHPLNSWDVSSVTQMNNMFSFASFFNHPLNSWDVSSVTQMNNMFSFASFFNHPLNSWDVSSVGDMSNMFESAFSFNGDLSSWNVSSVRNMNSMFNGARDFDQNLGMWYIVPAGTDFDAGGASLNVTTISAQNLYLERHNPVYAMGSYGNSSLFEMSGSTLAFKAAPGKGSYQANVTASGSAVFESDNNWRMLDITVSNSPPAVQAGDDQTVGEGDVVTLSGAATDHDGDPITYTWSQTASTTPLIAFVNSSAPSTTFVAPAVTGDTTFTLMLTADDDTQSATDTLNITVKETDAAFITTWSTTSTDQNITINFVGSGMNITWGDGMADTDVRGSRTHTYKEAGSHPVSVTGGLTGLTLHQTEDLHDVNRALELASIDQWGGISWTTMHNAFAGASNMVYRATDAPDLSGVANTSHMFFDAASFNGTLSDWNVSSVTDMNGMFWAASSFNQTLNSWNVSSVTRMHNMFNDASSFDQPLNSWSVSSVTEMGHMFNGATSFNQPLNNWDVSSVTSMNNMFNGASSFNGDLSSWNVSSVNDMTRMFDGADSFDQNLGTWYIVPAGTDFDAGGNSLDATTISAQNLYLGSHNLVYAMGSGDNFDLFEMRGSTLAFKAAPVKGSYQANVTASGTDVFESGNNWRVLDITVPDSPPTVQAGDDQTVGEGDVVTLSGAATDHDGDPITYAWSQTSPDSPLIAFVNSSAPSTTFVAPAVTGDTTFTLTLTADGAAQRVTDMLNITVKETGAAFITTWTASDSDRGITLPMKGTYSVLWGDGSYDVDDIEGPKSHTYADAGNYTVTVLGDGLQSISTGNDPTNALQLESIEQWGDTAWTTMDTAFLATTNMVYRATDAPDLSGVANMRGMFWLASSFNGDLSGWNVSSVRNMANMFNGASSFNGSLSGWNVSSVTDMGGMLKDAAAFNQPLNSWNVSSVTNMNGMFWSATSFNQHLNSWNVSSVTDMSFMFAFATSFNQTLNSWDVSSVMDMRRMFWSATSFNQHLNSWNVSSVTGMSFMFNGATFFNQPLNSWNVSSVTDMNSMFGNIRNFDQNLGTWYIVPATTDFDADGTSFNVTTISAQNSYLETPPPVYAMGSYGNSSLFEMSGSTLAFKAAPGAGSYQANVTASGNAVFGSGNNWRVLDITVRNSPPTVQAGGDQTVGEGDTVTLSGAAIDLNDDPITYTWSQTALPSIRFDNASAPSTTFVAPAVTSDTTFTITLTAHDGTQPVADTLSVTVKETGAAFITTWAATDSDMDITLPMTGTYSVLWGDGSQSANVSNSQSHSYTAAGNYTVTVLGDGLDRINLFGDDANAHQLESIEQWGGTEWTTMDNAFEGAANMTYRATDAPDLSKVTNMNGMFWGASSFDGDISDWDVSSVTDMSHMFLSATSFDQPLNNWDVSSVADMSRMFLYATSFDQHLNRWTVSSVLHMTEMFNRASSFNQPLNRWDVSSVTSMLSMFDHATAFDQNLGTWYIVPAGTDFDTGDNSLDVTTISAQNSHLGDHSLVYAMGSGDNFDLFEMRGSTLAFKAAPVKGSYQANVTASGTDVFESGNNWRVLDITVPDSPPTVQAGRDQTVGEGDTVTLSGSAIDPDGDPITYAWSQTSPDSPLIAFVNSSAPSTTFVAPAVTGDTVFTITLTADGAAQRVTDTLNITVREPGAAFITTWNTISAGQNITINFVGSGMNITWGDGTTYTNVRGSQNRTYAEAGSHTVSVTGGLTGLTLHRTEHVSGHDLAIELASIDQWGDISWTTMRNAFAGASNMTYRATDAPDLSGVANMDGMFWLAYSFNGDISGWDVSSVTSMNNMFFDASSFDGDLSDWNVSSVANMNGMFWQAFSFNQPLNSWNVSSVKSMSNMFNAAYAFNQTLNSWNVSSVTSMGYMFSSTRSFDQPLNSWNVSSVIDMNNMFDNARSFNQPLDSWDVSSTSVMESMFYNARDFDQNLGTWYIVPATTDFDADGASLNVTTISAQNSYLERHNPVYAMGSGDNFDLFEMRGSTLAFKAAPVKGSYQANVTASGTDVFESDNNWRVLDITVPDSPPTVQAGDDQTVGEGDVVTLSGAATDHDGDPITYAWSQTSPDSPLIAFVNSSAPSTTFVAPAVTEDTTFTLTLTADGAAQRVTDMLNITVKETSTAFITTWTVSDSDRGITLPMTGTYSVLWGDGSHDAVVTDSKSHTYTAAGTYTVIVLGDGLESIDTSNDDTNALQLESIEQWGDTAWTTMEAAFTAATNMTYRATDAPDLSGVNNMSGMFWFAFSFDGDLSGWNVSSVRNMANMFSYASSFNGDLSGWNVSSVTNMSYMFKSATSFNQTLNSWNVSSVTNMNSMFEDATSFNQTLNSWNVSSVTNMNSMFERATSFNQPLNSWNVSSVTNMNSMFEDATSFNQTLNSWNVSSVTNMNSMFERATSFNQPLNSWNVSSVTSMSTMFLDATSFNQPLNSWNVSSVNNMSYMFVQATSFNQPLDSWDVSSTSDMEGMFSDATSFDQNLGTWYIVPATTDFNAGGGSLDVTTISAQNLYLERHNLRYAMGSDDISDLFEMRGSTLAFKDAPGADSYQANVTVSGTIFGSGNSWRVLNITVSDSPPTVQAGDDQTVGEGDTVTLSGSATDSNDDPITYAWSQTAPASPLITFINASAPLTTFTAPAVTGDTTFTITLTADDGTQPATDMLNITVKETSTAFITTWNTISAGQNITINFVGSGMNITWGDGTADTDISDVLGSKTHTYAKAGSHTVSVTGGLTGLTLHRTEYPLSPDLAIELVSIDQWGDISWTTMRNAFAGASNMVYRATDAPNLGLVIDMTHMFSIASSFDGDISGWNVSSVTDMNGMFWSASSFDQPLNSWDVSSVTRIHNMFNGASSFNQTLNSWNVSSVTDMSGMFASASSFNQPLNTWNVSSVNNTSYMFNSATSFNRPLNDWDVSSVTDMSYMFTGATFFNQPLNTWNVSSVIYMPDMFSNAHDFDQNLGMWYIVPAGTDFDADGTSFNVTTISVQNLYLERHTPVYAMGSDDISDLFEMRGSTLAFKDAPGADSYQANVTASGTIFGSGNSWRVLDITVSNSPPTVQAGNNQTVGEGDTVTLSGSATDQGGNPITYTWSQTAPASPLITFINASAPSTTFVAPAVTGDTTFTITLTANDNIQSATDMLNITVKETGAAFITTWAASNSDKGITLPMQGTYSVLWGDDSYDAGVRNSKSHTYADAGNYTVTVLGDGLASIDLSGDNVNVLQIQSIEQWGGTEWTTMDDAFDGASNMVYRAIDAPNLSNVTDMSGMFRLASSFDGDLSGWNVSSVTDMSSMFNSATAFNGDLSGWNVSSVTDMKYMFSRTFSFNQTLNSWDVSSITDMTDMFFAASSFDGDLSGWNVSSVIDMNGMFSFASSFDGDLSGWNVSSVINMNRMFFDASSFNGTLSDWNVSSVTDMSSMFSGATVFNQPLNSWNVSSVIYMNNMFDNAHAFNQNLGMWYIVLDDTEITSVPGNVGGISTQNQKLRDQTPVYGIGGGYDSDAFEISSSNLRMKILSHDRHDYRVNITSTGSFGTGNHRVYNVTVTGNLAPELETIADRPIDEGALLEFTAVAHDPSHDSVNVVNDTLMFSLKTGAPNGASINLTSGAFTWTPTEMQDGAPSITVQVSDGRGGAASETITVTVSEVNTAPVLDAITPKGVARPDTLTFTATASDDDYRVRIADTVAFSLTDPIPSGASITSAGDFSWMPAANQTGSHDVTVTVTDGTGLTDSQNVAITVNTQPNMAPVLTAIGSKSVNELVLLEFNVTATDADGDSLRFSLETGAPSGASINLTSGAFTWTPTEMQDGASSITVQVSDGRGGAASETITVTVSEVNTAPVLDAITPKGVARPDTLTFTATASDDDYRVRIADTVAFSLTGTLLDGASITPAGNFSWMPAANQTGSHDVTVTVTDGTGLTDSQNVAITVNTQPNMAPVLTAIGSKSVNELVLLEFNVTATDADGDSLRFSLETGAPSGASINLTSGAFTWTPTEMQDGASSITVQVSDGRGGAASETITVTVSEVNTAPVLDAITPKGVARPDTLTFTATASDDDYRVRIADTVAFSLTGTLLDGASITPAGNFSWMPAANQTGSHDVTVTVTDGTGLTDSQNVAITVNTQPNMAPVLTAIGSKSVNELVLLEFNVTATDADGDSLRFSLETGAPSGASINLTSGAFTWTPTAPLPSRYKSLMAGAGPPLRPSR